jgi:ADP-ribose pyrophosphatase YjhB (NUDIX family)
MMIILEKLIEIAHTAAPWLSSRPNRLRIQGARIEVIAIVLSRNPAPLVLLGKSPYHNMWMPPQEGVRITETFSQAIGRCLETECGLKIPQEQNELAGVLYIRSIRYVGTIELPRERQGERLVADDAVGTALEHVRLKKKAYWMATILVGNGVRLELKPDGIELTDLRWFEIGEARQRILETNHPSKADFLLRCLDSCLPDITGATKAPHGDRYH